MVEEEALIREQTAELLRPYKRERNNLIPILQEVQASFRYLPKEAMLEIANFLEMPESAVYGVATFYNQFRLTPPGKHTIKVCMGTACHMKGGQLILDAWEREVGIEVGGVTPDREFGLERVACVGCCALAPVTVVDEEVHGRVTPTKIQGILGAFKREEGHDLRENSGASPPEVAGAEE